MKAIYQLIIFTVLSVLLTSAYAVNISQGKDTSASSYQKGYASGKAVDGVVSTDNRWTSDQIANASEWMTVNLASNYKITSINLTLGKGGANPMIPQDFNVKIDDGTGKFVSVPGFSKTGNKSASVTFTPGKIINTTRIRFECTLRADYCVVQEIVVNGNTVTDKGTGVNFGGNWQAMQKEDTVTLQEAAGVSYVRAAVTLPNFTGKVAELDYYEAHGQKYLLNVSAETADKFATDLTKFSSKLDLLLQNYKPEVLVVENEPATLAFYDDDLANYIAELETAIDVAKKYGVKVTDGSIHVQCIQAIMTNTVKAGTVCERQQYLLDQYAQIPDLDYVNFHLTVGGDGGLGDKNGFPAGVLADTANYVQNYSGHPVIANEYHFETNTQALMNSIVSEFRKANAANGSYKYSLMYSGDGSSKGLPFNNGNKLNALGTYFRDAVAAGK